MIVLLALACAGDDPVDSGDTGEPLDPTFTNVKVEIFQLSCQSSSCHGGRGSSDLSLDDDVAWSEIVNVESTDVPGEILVVPGDPSASYLVRKCRAEQGITGEPMPKGTPTGLDAPRLDLLEAWVAAGALDD
ncbi:MAG: hypothetical protein ACOZNI_02245 [Myxococcota bacterium]